MKLIKFKTPQLGPEVAGRFPKTWRAGRFPKIFLVETPTNPEERLVNCKMRGNFSKTNRFINPTFSQLPTWMSQEVSKSLVSGL